MTTKADITVNEGERVVYLHQATDGYPSGFATTLRAALQSKSGDRMLTESSLPRITAEHIKNNHLDASYRYELTRTETGEYGVRVLHWAINFDRPAPVFVTQYEFDTGRHVPIFEGSIAQFLAWSEAYDADSEEAISILHEASRKNGTAPNSDETK